MDASNLQNQEKGILKKSVSGLGGLITVLLFYVVFVAGRLFEYLANKTSLGISLFVNFLILFCFVIVGYWLVKRQKK